MARGKKMFKVLKSASGNADVAEMFNDMLNSSSKDPKAFYPKYEQLNTLVTRWIKLLEFARDLLLPFPNVKADVDAYVVEWKRAMANEYRFEDLPEECKLQLEAMPTEVREHLSEQYKLLKDSPIVASILVACQHVIVYKTFIENPDKFNDKFLTKTAGLTFSPIEDLPSLNFKQIYIDDRLDDNDRKMVLLLLNKMLSISSDVHEITTSPDVNVDELSTVIMSSISDVKKRIPRCDAAFRKILDAVDTLKGNFGGYYQDYVASSNPTIIMESFVLDVAKDSEPTPQLMRQFKDIIMYYQKVSKQHANNPKFKTLFGHLNKNLDKISQLTGKGSKSDDALQDIDELAEVADPVLPSPEDLEAAEAAVAVAAAEEAAANAAAESLIQEEEAAVAKKGRRRRRR